MNETRNCQNCKKDFIVEDEDFAFYKKMEVPPPTWCPECRMMRRMAFWNEHSFFKKIENRTGKEIFSMYPPDSKVEIYERDFWWSDGWDPLSYGRDIDWSRPFLQQFKELKEQVPWASLSKMRCTNSDYSNNCADMKNCYLCFNADQCEDSMYGVGLVQLKNCVDIFRCGGSELLYESFATFNSYQCFFNSLCRNNRNVWFSYDCEDCSDCFGCVNLRHQQYQIFNQQYTKEEYFAKLKELDLGSFKALSAIKKKFIEHMLRFPRKYMVSIRNVNVTGDYFTASKNVKKSYAGVNCENVAYSQSILMGAKESYDYTNWGNNVEFTYETQSVGEDVQRIKFSYECFSGASDIEYSIYCPGSSNLFGCVGLNKKSYCILNKQYSKEEYGSLVLKIKKHMLDMPYVDARGRVYAYGEFFPLDFSPYAVNETAVMDFMDMTKEKAQAYGLPWREPNPVEYKMTLSAADLPDHINDVKDEIVKEVIGCSGCGKGYRIVSNELIFLRRFGLPLPRTCFSCRHAARVKLRNLPVWYQGNCRCAGEASQNGAYKNITGHGHEGRCPNTFETTFAPDRPEIVYCESCWQAEVLS